MTIHYRLHDNTYSLLFNVKQFIQLTSMTGSPSYDAVVKILLNKTVIKTEQCIV